MKKTDDTVSSLSWILSFIDKIQHHLPLSIITYAKKATFSCCFKVWLAVNILGIMRYWLYHESSLVGRSTISLYSRKLCISASVVHDHVFTSYQVFIHTRVGRSTTALHSISRWAWHMVVYLLVFLYVHHLASLLQHGDGEVVLKSSVHGTGFIVQWKYSFEGKLVVVVAMSTCLCSSVKCSPSLI